eukprot:5063701-Lingulodinium_polyedra.AAC.1
MPRANAPPLPARNVLRAAPLAVGARHGNTCTCIRNVCDGTRLMYIYGLRWSPGLRPIRAWVFETA